MSKNYDQIATVDIDLDTPIVDETSFDHMLIVGPLPQAEGAGTIPKFGAYASLEEVEEAGWVSTGEGSDPIGVAARVAFSQSPTPDVVYIAPIQLVESEDDPETMIPEDVVETVKRCVSDNSWYVICTAGVDPMKYEEIAAYIEAQEKMFCYTELDFFGTDADGADKATVGDVYFRTMCIYGREAVDQDDEDIPDSNRYLNVAYVAKWLNYQSGSETSAFKTLAAVFPSGLSTTQMKSLKDNHMNYFIKVGNKNITMNGMVMAGEWADIIRFRDWLKNDMQIRVANLFVTRPKVPYTDNGIALVQNQMIAALKNGRDIGGIAEDEYDEEGNVIPGFTTSVPLASSLSASEKASRKLTRCRFKGRLTGAIHFAELTGSLTYEV